MLILQIRFYGNGSYYVVLMCSFMIQKEVLNVDHNEDKIYVYFSLNRTTSKDLLSPLLKRGQFWK